MNVSSVFCVSDMYKKVLLMLWYYCYVIFCLIKNELIIELVGAYV